MSQGFATFRVFPPTFPLSISQGGTGQTTTTGSDVLPLSTGGTLSQPNITGVINASVASAGNVGEEITASRAIGSASAMTTGTLINVTSMSLTAGDWDVRGVVGFAVGGSTVLATISGGSSVTSLTLTTERYSNISFPAAANPVGPSYILTIPYQRISLATTTTVYLVAVASFSVAGCSGYGSMSARRVR